MTTKPEAIVQIEALRAAAVQIQQRDFAGWGNTCNDAADYIAAQDAEIARHQMDRTPSILARKVENMTTTRDAFRDWWESNNRLPYDDKFGVVRDGFEIWRAATAYKRKPLSDAEIDAVTDAQWGKGCEPNQYLAHRAYARAILKAGIGKPK